MLGSSPLHLYSSRRNQALPCPNHHVNFQKLNTSPFKKKGTCWLHGIRYSNFIDYHTSKWIRVTYKFFPGLSFCPPFDPVTHAVAPIHNRPLDGRVWQPASPYLSNLSGAGWQCVWFIWCPHRIGRTRTEIFIHGTNIK